MAVPFIRELLASQETTTRLLCVTLRPAPTISPIHDAEAANATLGSTVESGGNGSPRANARQNQGRRAYH